MAATKSKSYTQHSFLYPELFQQLNLDDELIILGKNINWTRIEKELEQFFSPIGRPSKPIRLSVGLLIVKQIYNLSDERVVEEYMRNPYIQVFCGATSFQTTKPCHPTDLVYFRKRIGEEGIEKILQASVEIHGKAALEDDVIVDTTCQEKAITYPTDTKLRMKVISRCWKLAAKAGVKWRRSYRRELHEAIRTIRFTKKQKGKKQARDKALRRVKTIANALLRELRRKLPESILKANLADLEMYEKAVNQERYDKNKIYSLHEPSVSCICKGKEHKKYEFGAKAGLVMTKTINIIVGAKSFSGNPHDSQTLEPLLMHVKKIRGVAAKRCIGDRGFRGQKEVDETEIVIPDTPKKNKSAYAKRKSRHDFRRRGAIEPVIGHAKNDCRLAKNYLKGSIGDSINLLLSAAAFNFKKWMNALRDELIICNDQYRYEWKAA